jgi:hypothetical protein
MRAQRLEWSTSELVAIGRWRQVHWRGDNGQTVERIGACRKQLRDCPLHRQHVEVSYLIASYLMPKRPGVPINPQVIIAPLREIMVHVWALLEEFLNEQCVFMVAVLMGLIDRTLVYITTVTRCLADHVRACTWPPPPFRFLKPSPLPALEMIKSFRESTERIEWIGKVVSEWSLRAQV